MNIVNEIYKMGIVPVVVLDNSENALPLADALYEGGIRTMEITFRTDAAEQSIKNLVSSNTKMLIGAGTVTTVELAQKAVHAGAKYIVSPGFNPKVTQWCLDNSIPVIPGVNSPSQVEQVMNLGLDTMKFFPAEQSGGVPMLKTLASVYKAKFMPTGGISITNMNEYLSLCNVIAVGGSWICPKKLIENNNYTAITLLSKQAISTMHNFHILHVGINSKDNNEALSTANTLCSILGCEKVIAKDSYYVNDMFEILKMPFLGTNGHIGIAVNNLERAMQYFTEKGIEFNHDTYQEHKLVYFQNEIAGFAVHLTEV